MQPSGWLAVGVAACFPLQQSLEIIMPLSVPDFVPVHFQQLALPIEPAVLPQLAEYLGRLLDANRRFNLTGIRDTDEAWKRHIIDSLTLLPGLEHLTSGAKVIDVGSGGGLPGMPLAIAR